MADILEFRTAKQRKEPIKFTIDEDEFTFTPHKTAGMVLDILDDESELKAAFDWLDEGLPEDQSALLEKRLRDPEDDLDVDMVAEIIKFLISRVSGRPTKPSSGSRRQRKHTGRR